MQYLLHPLSIALYSAAIGVAVKKLQKSRWLAIGLPPLLVIGLIIVSQFLMTDQGGGFSFWPIAMIMGGTTAIAGGIVGYSILGRFVRNSQ